MKNSRMAGQSRMSKEQPKGEEENQKRAQSWKRKKDSVSRKNWSTTLNIGRSSSRGKLFKNGFNDMQVIAKAFELHGRGGHQPERAEE